MKMQYAPIALFTYNRADHTRQAVESLLKNEEAKYSELFIFSDGAKTPEKQRGVDENRAYIHTVSGFKSVTIIEREKNWGLANSLIAGITEIVNKYGRVIVVEDDLILSPYFLKFMNEALEKYEEDERVSAVSAFLEPTEAKIEETFFLRYFDCWGWGTWKEAWRLFNPDASQLLRKMRWKTRSFNVGGYGGYYGMLYCQKEGLIDSWAIRFYASSFLAEKLVLFPYKSLVLQNGFDGSGIHNCKDDGKWRTQMILADSPINIRDVDVLENKYMYQKYSDYYKKNIDTKKMSYFYRKIKFYIRILIGIDYR